MEAKELKIGNWVLVDSNLHCKVEYIETENWGGSIGLSGTSEKILKDGRVEPIPLTEEWLLKVDSKNMYQHELGIVIFGKSYSYAFSRDDPAINYVHQLQNLYFALTGKELEFKNNN